MTRQEQKLRSVILYLAKNVADLGVIKLFKLMWFLDEQHFVLTGDTVTGIDDYMALPMGPVPSSLYAQISENALPIFLADTIVIEKHPRAGIGVHENAKIIRAANGADPDFSIFTPREMEILRTVTSSLGKETATSLSNKSHKDGDLWDRYTKNPELARKKMDFGDLVEAGKTTFGKDEWNDHVFGKFLEKKLADA